MKAIRTSIMGIAAALTLFMTIGMLSIQYQQQVWSPRDCGSCVEFKKMTREFEKSVEGLMAQPPPDDGRQLAMLFDNYERATFELFGLTPPPEGD